MRAGGVACGLLIAWLACCAGAHAQSRRATGRTHVGASSHYEDLVAEAVREFSAGNFVEARTLFEQAHALKPSARTLRGLGSTAYELKHYVESVGELQDSLSDARNPLTNEQRAEVTDTLAKAKRYVGTLVVKASPAEASVLIDGTPTLARELLLDAGDHLIAARATGYSPSQQKVIMVGGQTLTADLQLSPLELSPAQVAGANATPSATSSSPAAQPATDSSEPSRGLLSRWWFWAGAGAIVATAIVVGIAAGSGGSTKIESPAVAGASTRVRQL